MPLMATRGSLTFVRLIHAFRSPPRAPSPAGPAKGELGGVAAVRVQGGSSGSSGSSSLYAGVRFSYLGQRVCPKCENLTLDGLGVLPLLPLLPPPYFNTCPSFSLAGGNRPMYFPHRQVT